MSSTTHTRRAADATGFTLVELLVVIGIIALLLSVLLPALNKARTAGQITACLSNIRQLSMAVITYANENKGTMPEAVYQNKTSLLSPKGTGQGAWKPYTHPILGATYTMPSIGEALRKYVGNSDKVWICPTGTNDYQAIDPYTSTGADPMSGFSAADVWIPNYFYMTSKLYLGLSSANPSVAATRVKPGFDNADWLVRNIAGLRQGQIRTVTRQTTDKIVVFVEYKSTFHTRSAADIYNLGPGEKTNYVGNFAYLDGHAETRRYRDRDGYVSQLHDPIPQKWYGKDFTVAFAEQYDPGTSTSTSRPPALPRAAAVPITQPARGWCRARAASPSTMVPGGRGRTRASRCRTSRDVAGQCCCSGWRQPGARARRRWPTRSGWSGRSSPKCGRCPPRSWRRG